MTSSSNSRDRSRLLIFLISQCRNRLLVVLVRRRRYWNVRKVLAYKSAAWVVFDFNFQYFFKLLVKFVVEKAEGYRCSFLRALVTPHFYLIRWHWLIARKCLMIEAPMSRHQHAGFWKSAAGLQRTEFWQPPSNVGAIVRQITLLQ